MSPRRSSRQTGAGSASAALPEAELEVLACLHDLGEAPASELRRAMGTYRPMSHASMMTLLGRLADKSLVSRRKGERGKAFLYRATEDAGRTYRSVLDRVVERVFRNRRLALVASLFDGDAPSRDELTELRGLVRKLEGKAGRGRG